MVPESVLSSAVTLTGPDGALTATFLPQAGMICTSLTHRGDELLAQRGGLEKYLERGSTFGLPILYPWANRLSAWRYSFGGVDVALDPGERLIHTDPDSGVPLHGVLGGAPDWQIATHTGTHLHAELDYGAVAARLAAFPFPHHLSYGAELTETDLVVTLTVTPTGGVIVPVSFGFHPYLLPGGTREAWQLSGPVPGLDGPLCDRSFDDGYENVPGASFSVHGEQRTLGVSFLTGYANVQIFSPPGANFICFEPMTAPTDALVTAHGLQSTDSTHADQVFSASFAITVGP